MHKSCAPMKKTAGDVPGVKSGAKPSKLQLAMAEKNQAKSGKQKMFKVEEACCIRFSPNSKRLAVGSRDNNIYIFDVEKKFRRIGICRGHTSYITHIDFSLNGDFMQSNSGDYELLYWQAPESETFRTSHVVAGSPRSRYVCFLCVSSLFWLLISTIKYLYTISILLILNLFMELFFFFCLFFLSFTNKQKSSKEMGSVS